MVAGTLGLVAAMSFNADLIRPALEWLPCADRYSLSALPAYCFRRLHWGGLPWGRHRSGRITDRGDYGIARRGRRRPAPAVRPVPSPTWRPTGGPDSRTGRCPHSYRYPPGQGVGGHPGLYGVRGSAGRAGPAQPGRYGQAAAVLAVHAGPRGTRSPGPGSEDRILHRAGQIQLRPRLSGGQGRAPGVPGPPTSGAARWMSGWSGAAGRGGGSSSPQPRSRRVW
jgi:hypothetical protein